MHQPIVGPSWLTGGGFGLEGGVVGIAFLVVMMIGVALFARGSTGPWRISAARAASASTSAPASERP